MSDYRVTVKVRNNRLLKAIEDVGGKTGQKWCETQGLSYAGVNDLVNMVISPLTKEGKLTATAARLCEVLDKLPEELWSNEQIYPLERNFSELEMNHAQVMALIPSEQKTYQLDCSEIEQGQVTGIIDCVVSSLTAREQEVIKLRFYEGLTLEQCGRRMDITQGRVLQIQNKALRNLRHPSKSFLLKDALDLIDNPD